MCKELSYQGAMCRTRVLTSILFLLFNFFQQTIVICKLQVSTCKCSVQDGRCNNVTLFSLFKILPTNNCVHFINCVKCRCQGGSNKRSSLFSLLNFSSLPTTNQPTSDCSEVNSKTFPNFAQQEYSNYSTQQINLK